MGVTTGATMGRPPDSDLPQLSRQVRAVRFVIFGWLVGEEEEINLLPENCYTYTNVINKHARPTLFIESLPTIFNH